MALILNNSFFKISNSSFRTISPLSAPPVGQIFRVVNTGGTTDSLSYTKINGSTASTGNLTNAQVTYVLALSGSLSDNGTTGAGGQLTITNLRITSSVDETPTFTEQVITTTGAGTFTKPAGVTEVIIECWGGGGSGGGAIDNPAAGGGGGGGQYSRKYIQYSSPSIGISYSIGTGGVGTTGTGANGGDTTWNTNTVIAKGGTGGGANGSVANGNATGGVGNTAGSVADVIYFGGNGYQGQVAGGGAAISGGGGGGAGSVGNGNSSLSAVPGDIKQQFGGIGGLGLENVGGNGQIASVYGAGGGGGCATTNTNRSGGDGEQGLIRIIYR
jgi:hypothetical protein